MDAAVIVAIVAASFALVSACAATWSVVVATKANNKADTANETSCEANRIAVKANEISESALEHQKRHAPPAWSGVEVGNRGKRQVENTSGRDVIITAFRAVPESESRFLCAENLPAEISYGDWYRFSTSETTEGRSLDTVDIHWHYADTPDEPHVTKRSLP